VGCLPTNGPAEVNVAYSATCTASGGTSPYTFSVTPNPPVGVTLSSFTATTATISGSPTSSGGYSYVVKVTDAASLTASQAYSGTVAPAPSLNCVPTTGPTEVGVAYSTTCTASGGTAPYAFFVNPNPPAGVNLSSFTATTVTVSGIPTSSGGYSYVVRVTDAASQSASQAYSGTVAPAPALNCLPTTGPTEVGVAYSTTCTASGGTSPYTFSVIPNPPAGVTLSSFTATTATVSGSPTSSGGYGYVVQVTDAASQSASQSYSGAVAPAPSMNCLPTTGPTETNVAYSATCTVAGGTSPYTWSINPGTLPTGVNLSSSTGTSVTISGSPTSSGGYNYTVKATDAASQSAAQSYSGVILGAVSISCLPTAGPTEVSVAYSATCTVSGGTSPYTWSISSGALPTGVNLSSNTGSSVTISGSPTSSGSYNYTVQATDSASQSAAQSYSGTVTPVPILTSLNPTSATVGGTAFTLTANGSGFASGGVRAMERLGVVDRVCERRSTDGFRAGAPHCRGRERRDHGVVRRGNLQHRKLPHKQPDPGCDFSEPHRRGRGRAGLYTYGQRERIRLGSVGAVEWFRVVDRVCQRRPTDGFRAGGLNRRCGDRDDHGSVQRDNVQQREFPRHGGLLFAVAGGIHLWLRRRQRNRAL
jgi:hypothetical protein